MRTLKSSLLASALMLSTMALAQSDGSLEEAYARECPQHQDTAACNALRDALLASAAAPVASTDNPADVGQDDPVWGAFASLPGTVWKSTDGWMFKYEWVVPGELMQAVVLRPGAIMTNRYQRSADNRVQALIAGESSIFEAVRAGVMLQTTEQRRATYYLSPDAIRVVSEQLVNGVWKPGASMERRRSTIAEFDTAYGQLTEKQRIYDATWGKLPQLVGYWTSGTYVWRGQWNRGKTILTADVWTTAGEFAYKFRFYVDATRELQAASGASNYKVAMLPNGNVFLDGTDDAIIWRSATAFDFENGRMKAGAYVRKDSQTAGWNGTYRKMSPAQTQAFRDQVKRYDQQQASGGDSGLFGALAMATGAALAGGNAEHVMGAAMKGAELSTDNQMTRNVLAGQGDQMIATGTQRMYEESARRSSPSSSGPQGAGPASRTASMLPSPLSGASGASGAAESRMGYYACNAFNVSTRVTYYSPIVERPYDDQSWLRRLADDFASLTARFYPGEYHGGGATCWARRSQAEAADEIAQAKRWAAANYGDRTARDVIEWAPPEP